MNPSVLMGDPTYFRIEAGPNPFTRNRWGIKKNVDRDKAIKQWHRLAQKLTALGVAVYVIPPEPHVPGLVYPANAGFLAENHTFVLSHLIESRAPETPFYKTFLNEMGFKTTTVSKRFEGEADFFPFLQKMIFTYGKCEKQRFALRLGIPPWKRVYGFRSDSAVLPELQKQFPKKEIVPLELIDESYYHGDTALCAFGPEHQYLMVYPQALKNESRQWLESFYKDRLILLDPADARIYAANSAYFETSQKKVILMPEGISSSLVNEIESLGIEVILADVSEFWKKGGGSVKCMIGHLGFLPEPESDKVRSFRERHLYSLAKKD